MGTTDTGGETAQCADHRSCAGCFCASSRVHRCRTRALRAVRGSSRLDYSESILGRRDRPKATNGNLLCSSSARCSTLSILQSASPCRSRWHIGDRTIHRGLVTARLRQTAHRLVPASFAALPPWKRPTRRQGCPWRLQRLLRLSDPPSRAHAMSGRGRHPAPSATRCDRHAHVH